MTSHLNFRRAPRRLPGAVLLALVLAAAPDTARAQDVITESLAFDRPEAWAMARLNVLTLHAGYGAGATSRPADGFTWGVEAGWVPALDADERRIGFFGTKEEDTNKTPLFARVRGGWRRGALSVSVAATPPVTVGGATPALISGSLGVDGVLPVGTRGAWRGALRVSAQRGRITGDITCPADVAARGEDPVGNPFRCERASEDEARPHHVAAEASLGRGVGRVRPYVAFAIVRHDTRFDVRADYSDVQDRTRQVMEGTSSVVSAGARVATWRGLPLAVEGVWAPLRVQRRFDAPVTRGDVWTVRALFGS